MEHVDNERPRRKTRTASDNVLDVFQAAWLIGAHVETLRRLARRGDVPAYKIGKDWRFSKAAVEGWRDMHHLRSKPPLALVVDDDGDIRRLIGFYLEQDGYRVALARNGRDALDSARQETPDVVLLDLRMPGMSGAEVLSELRVVNPDLPVIIVTGYPDSERVAEAMRYPPVMLLAKPVNKEELLRSVHCAIHGAGGRRWKHNGAGARATASREGAVSSGRYERTHGLPVNGPLA
jgi:excisionase family DNA binding protein